VWPEHYRRSALGPLSVAAALALDGAARRRAGPRSDDVPADGPEQILVAV
jgi:hypothetical protein